MDKDFKVGCTYNFLQPNELVPPLRWFELCKATEAFDYINWLPPTRLIDECIAASEKTGMPMTTGNCTHRFSPGNARLFEFIENAGRVNMAMLNVMLLTYAEDGQELTDEQILSLYMKAADFGAERNVEVSFELHVDCWTEKYKRVSPIIAAARAKGYKFNFTLDYSHVVFKIDNPAQQEISDVREDVEAGRIVLDPFEKGSILDEWLAQNVISFAQFRPVAPNQPANSWARNEDGSMPRGIMYPFVKPKPGEWHSRWDAWRLATCKEAFRKVLRYHLTHDASPLRFVITEMIARPDYGLNAKFSLLEQNAACARWIRSAFAQMKAMQAAGIPLEEGN